MHPDLKNFPGQPSIVSKQDLTVYEIVYNNDLLTGLLAVYEIVYNQLLSFSLPVSQLGMF